ncbi:hypothetical protein ACIA8O_13320 [Kitasatospora sp. NPDC051853]|uniref:hypothetical protein n=1 Tax=Kitasatospora sp. NPDC051853 TaxID=3364058 RepID=UPI0037982CA6
MSSSAPSVRRSATTPGRSRPGPTDPPGPPLAPPPGRAAARRRARARQPALLSRYLGYVGYFVGAGLISGAVVHHPLDPARYTVIGLAGAAVFLCAAVLAELQSPGRTSPGRLVLVLGSSLALSFGIGMLSGGLQHFEDFPNRAAVLVPLGLLLSFLAYVVKEAERPARRILGLPGLAVLVVTLVAFAGLRQVAAGLDVPAGGHSHSHGGEEEHEEAPAAPASAPAATPSVQPSAAAPGSAPGSVPPSSPPPSSPKPSGTGHFADGHKH